MPVSEKLSAYQRCMTVIEGNVPDMMPVYIPTIACDVASQILGRQVNTGGPSLWYAEAKAYAAGDNAHKEFVEEYEKSLLELNRVLGIEVFRYGWRKQDRPTAQLNETTFLYGDQSGVHQIWRWDESANNFLEIKNTATKRVVEDLPKIAKQMAKDLPANIEKIRNFANLPERRLQKEVGDEMMIVAGGAGLSVGLDEAALMACSIEPDAIGDILDCQLETGLAQLEVIAKCGIKVVLGGGDMADKNGPMYSPKMFRDLVLPRLKKLIERSQQLNLHYVWRTDGNIWPVADMIFNQAGVPGYGEVDYDASMETGRIRELYPDVVIWSNASGDFLRQNNPKEVYDYCAMLLDQSKGSHYFHGCSNTILSGTPAENVWAMMEARNNYKPEFV